MIDSSKIDDIYTKLTFNVNDPWIRVNNQGDHAVGEPSSPLQELPNLQLMIRLSQKLFVSSSFQTADKTQDLGKSGVTHIAKVVEGEGTDNIWSVEVDTTNFNLVEKVVTTIPTTAVPTETPKTPGFGAFSALAGLGAVELLVLRRK